MSKKNIGSGVNYRNMFVQELYPIQRCALEAENQQFLNPSLSFDGKELAILDNGNLVKSWKALSGRRKMQCKTNTDNKKASLFAFVSIASCAQNNVLPQLVRSALFF